MTALCGAAGLAMRQADHARAEALATECLSLARHLAERGEDDWQAEPLMLLGYVVDDLARAQGFLEQVVSLTRTRNDDGALSTALADLGMCLNSRDDLAASRRAFEEAAALAQRSGDEFLIGYVRSKMAYLVRSEGDVAAAAALFEEALAWSRAQGVGHAHPGALRDLGMLRLLLGDVETARAHFAEAMPVLASAGDVIGLIRCLEGFGPVAAARGQAARAARLFGAAERQRETLGRPLPEIDRADYDAVPSLRESLGPEAFGAACAQGQAMSLEQATAYAALAEDG
jgi:tetratricopeptide (TPR) repeat protein